MIGTFDSWLQLEGIDPSSPLGRVAQSIYQQESSGGKNTTTSNRGARGGMQIIPSTFKGVADKGWDINNPEHNGRAGIRYIKDMHKHSGGDPYLTAVGYYGGPGGINKARKGIEVHDPVNKGKAPTTFQYAAEVLERAGLPPTMGHKVAQNDTPQPVVNNVSPDRLPMQIGPGTQGSMGTESAQQEEQPDPFAELRRLASGEPLREREAALAEKWGKVEQSPEKEVTEAPSQSQLFSQAMERNAQSMSQMTQQLMHQLQSQQQPITFGLPGKQWGRA